MSCSLLRSSVVKNFDGKYFIDMFRLVINDIEVIGKVHGLICVKAIDEVGWMMKIILVGKDNIVVIGILPNKVSDHKVII